MKTASIYIHIPFCDHKCIYCDFYSIITLENISEFIVALKKEMDYYSSKYYNNTKFTSIFFGGGTPSILPIEEFDEIINYLYKKFSFSEQIEITLETNPGTVDKRKLKLFNQTGVNRLSIGIQSFDDDELKFLTRIHNKKTALDTIYLASDVGFENINIDLIFNLPNQTKIKWIQNLEIACKLPIKHISTYSLTLETGTILNKMVLDGKVNLQDDDYDADLYQITIDYLTKHLFSQYEVSNFAIKGFECKHNLNYWQHNNYLGLGPSAHSYFENQRWWNFTSLKKYIYQVKQNQNAIMNKEILSKQQIQNEFIMLALRSNGLNLYQLIDKFGESIYKEFITKISRYIELGYMVKKNNIVSLTPVGYAVCDEILKNIL